MSIVIEDVFNSVGTVEKDVLVIICSNSFSNCKINQIKRVANSQMLLHVECTRILDALLNIG